MRAVQAVSSESTAVPDRYNNLLIAVFVAYEPEPGDEEGKREVDEEGVNVGKEVQRLLAAGAGDERGLDAYVNYAFGDEGVEAW